MVQVAATSRPRHFPSLTEEQRRRLARRGIDAEELGDRVLGAHRAGRPVDDQALDLRSIILELAGVDVGDAPSPRELEVIAGIAGGQSNTAIAATLGISEETIKSHVRHALARTATANRTHLVATAIRNGWID